MRLLPEPGPRCSTWATRTSTLCLHKRYIHLLILYSGYLESCKSIVSAAKAIEQRVRAEIPELRVLGNPPGSVVAFAAAHGTELNVLEVGDKMSKMGWHLNGASNPPAVHIAVTVRLSRLSCSVPFPLRRVAPLTLPSSRFTLPPLLTLLSL